MDKRLMNFTKWNAESIKQRGLKILTFLEDEWNFYFASRADKIKTLGLGFMVEVEDYDTDVVEPIYQETIQDNNYSNIEEPLYLKVNDIIYATGYFIDNGILIKAGSKIRSEIVLDREYMKNKVEKDRAKAKIKDNIFIEDMFYDSPSRAANVILSLNKNGWTNWRNSKGITLEELAGRKNN